LKAKEFWVSKLDISPRQIKEKVTVIIFGRIGAYRQKFQNGVLTLEYYNRKLRDIICDMIDALH